MAMETSDLHDLIRILEQHPEWRSELRRVLLSDDLLQLPDLVREIAEAHQQHSQEMAQIRATLSEVVQIQREHSEKLAELSAAMVRLAEAQQRTDELVARLSQRVEELAEAQQRTDESLARLSQRVEELAEAQQRTDESVARLSQRVEELAEAQQRTDESVARLSQRVEELAEAQRRTEQRMEELVEAQRLSAASLNRLMDWQRGEAGRREGEQYEQQTVRRASLLFAGGDGGSPAEPHIRRLLTQWMTPIHVDQRMLEPASDPTLSDIIWRKGEQVLLVEVSLKVNGEDVRRARMRAETLRALGIDVMPVVLGEEWASPESSILARQEGVEWMVAGGLSERLLQFRRVRAETLDAPRPPSGSETNF